MKKLLITICFLLMASSVIAEPISHFAEQVTNDDIITATIYSYPKFYKDVDTYKAVDTTIVQSQDVGWDWEVKKGVYSLRIKNDGTFEVSHLGDKYTQKLTGIGFYNSDTKERIVKNSFTLSNPVINGNTISWSLPLDCTYKIIYVEDTLKDILVISQRAKDWLKANKPDGWTLDNSWIGLIYDMDLTQSSMIESKDFDTDGDISFKKDGRVKHRIIRKEVLHERFDIDNPTDKHWVKKKIYKNGKYVEAIPVEALDSENGSLVFNTDVVFQEGTDSYTGSQFCYFYDFDPTLHATNLVYLRYGAYNLFLFDVSSIPATAVVSAATISINIYEEYNSGTVNVAAGSIADPSDSGGWTDYGSSTGGEYNTKSNYRYKIDDAVNLRWETGGTNLNITDVVNAAEDTISVTTTGWKSWSIPIMVQDWIDGDLNNTGLWIREVDASNARGYGKYAATASDRPKLSISYTVPAGGRTRRFF